MVTRTFGSCLLGVVIVLAAACRPDHRTRLQGPVTMRLVNATSSPICEVYFANTKSNLWGKSWIDQKIPSGGHADLPVRPDSYMMRVGTCAGNTAIVVYHVDVEDDIDFVIHEDYVIPAPTRAVDQLAFPTSKHLMNHGLRHVQKPDAGQSLVEVTVTSRCARDLRVVLGGDPSGKTGEPSTVPAGSFARYAAPESTSLWIVDAEYAPVSATKLSTAHKKLEIAATCDGWTTG